MNSHVRYIASAANPALIASVFMLLVVGGCEQAVRRVAVSGKVLIDGEPLTLGMIRFVPETGRPSSSKISVDGSFRVVTKTHSSDGAEIVGLIPGSYRIAVSSVETLGESEDAEVRWLVPRHYGNFRTSGLEAIVQAPTESMIVELTWAGAEEDNAETGPKDSIVNEADRETREK